MTLNELKRAIESRDCSEIEGVICTDYAVWARDVVGRGLIVGFFDCHNPGTATGRESGGHDFLLVDDRYVVDLWLREVVGWTDQVVFDLQKPADDESVRKYYGDRQHWQLVPR